jgi:hypothetical protein
MVLTSCKHTNIGQKAYRLIPPVLIFETPRRHEEPGSHAGQASKRATHIAPALLLLLLLLLWVAAGG